MNLRGRQIVLGVTGGIAAFKAVLLLRLLTRAGAQVRVVMTPSAARFVTAMTFEALSGHPVEVDLWSSTTAGGESHVRLAQWAQAVVVAPATANFMSEQAHGQVRDLLGAVCLATVAPVLVAPAMHENMWRKPSVQRVVSQLREDGFACVGPVVGDLATGAGEGRMAEPEQILEALLELLTPKDLMGKRVLITAGPTREPLDPVRFLSNHSTGKMGYALAAEAARRGAQVTLVSGPTSLDCPAGVQRVDVVTAGQMYEAVLSRPDFDICIMSAAVADYTPEAPSAHKIKKADGAPQLVLTPTRDILKTVGGQRRPGQVLIGFAMETRDLVEAAQKKVASKGCDLIVANSLVEPGAGFGHNTNKVTLVPRIGEIEALPLMDKAEVAAHILSWALGFAGEGA